MTGSAERRSGERRQCDRRQPPEGRDDQLGSTTDHAPASFHTVFEAPSSLTAVLNLENEGPEAGLHARTGGQPAHGPGSALARIVRTYAAARAALGLALVVAQGVLGSLGSTVTPAVLGICLVYALLAAVPWLLPRLALMAATRGSVSIRRRQWALTIGLDLLAFGLLHVLDAGTSFNYAALLVLPVLMSGVLTSRMVALGTAAGVALLLLIVSLRSVGGALDGAAVLAQSGLAGMGLFVIAVLAGELASRMAREERAARGSLEIARQQAQLNRLVIQEMADGVLVLDRRMRVRAANPAARQLLAATGLAPAAPFMLTELPAAAPLCAWVEQAMNEERWPEAGQDLQMVFTESHRRTLRVRVRFTRGGLGLDESPQRDRIQGAGEGLCVVLLEDARTAQARLRQEKLAAMGRLSAGIAHEFRNPLAAIAQANALMQEDALPPTQHQLSRLVADNVKRLQRIVDDVLELAPGSPSEAGVIDVRAVVDATVREWAQTVDVGVCVHARETARVRLDLPEQSLDALFDPDHLRRVLVNLLDNALRHSSTDSQAIVLRLAVRDDVSVVLSLANDGPPIAPNVEPHLFEPFFSTRSRGSGLGLYICRELCERYGASIEFRARAPNDRHRNGFVINLRRGPLPVAPDVIGGNRQNAG